MTTIGAGRYTYKLIHDWAKLPTGQTFARVGAVSTDSQDRVYAFQPKDPPVVVFDRNGNYLSSWGNGAFKYAHGFYIANDIVYVTDRDGSVCLMYTLDGKPIRILGRHGVHSDSGGVGEADLVPRAAGPFNYPTKMVTDSAGDMYVSDGHRNARVHRFSPEGLLKFSWGEPGKAGRGQFHVPHSLLVHEGLVYVCDRDNNRIQVFTTDGEHIASWPGILRPNDISIDREGTLYVSEHLGEGAAADAPGRISVLDRKGDVLARFGSRGYHGSCVDSHGDIYVGIGGPKGPSGLDKFVRLS